MSSPRPTEGEGASDPEQPEELAHGDTLAGLAPAEDSSSGVKVAIAAAEHVTVKRILLGAGPRFARDAFGPVLVFYIGWRLVGLVLGIAAATLVSLASWQFERRRDRAGLVVRLSLAFVIVQATIGLLSQSAIVYLAQPVLLAAALGFAFLVSVAVGRPLAGVFADEIYPFPPEVRRSATFARVFARISILWGLYQLLRSGIRLLALFGGGVEVFVVVNLLTGVPLTAGLMSWSVWYALRSFRRSEEWGWAQ
jgi:hypothetical protein